MTKISFDLDDTLMGVSAPREPLGVVARLLGTERLRLGTRSLFRSLRAGGHAPCVYTTSLRPHWRIWLTFRLHGLRVDRIVNGDDHKKSLAASAGRSSKIPDAFGFAVHVDDAPIAQSEDDIRAKVIIVSPDDDDWTRDILAEIERHTRQHPGG